MRPLLLSVKTLVTDLKKIDNDYDIGKLRKEITFMSSW